MSDQLRAQFVHFEGRRNVAYPDPLTGGSPWTIGIGHTGPEVHEHLVWADSLIDSTFENDLAKANAQLLAYVPGVAGLAEPRYAVLLNMVFQMGIHRLLEFQHTLHAVLTSDWQAAHDGMLDSLWAKQTPYRAQTLAKQMLTGEWQTPPAKP